MLSFEILEVIKRHTLKETYLLTRAERTSNKESDIIRDCVWCEFMYVNVEGFEFYVQPTFAKIEVEGHWCPVDQLFMLYLN